MTRTKKKVKDNPLYAINDNFYELIQIIQDTKLEDTLFLIKATYETFLNEMEKVQPQSNVNLCSDESASIDQK